MAPAAAAAARASQPVARPGDEARGLLLGSRSGGDGPEDVHRDGGHRHLRLDDPELTLERLDLGLPLHQLALDRHHVGDVRGPVEQRAQPGGARGRAREPALEIDDLRGHVVGRDLPRHLRAESGEPVEHGGERRGRDLEDERRVAGPHPTVVRCEKR